MPRPFEGSYAVSLTIALLALVPFILVTTSYELFRPQVIADVGVGAGALSIISGIATAGYAFGALLGGDLIQRFAQRRLFFACESLFVAGSVLAGIAGDPEVFGTGRVLQGFATGLLLVVALPPVVQRFGPGRLPLTTAFVNIGFFGATAAGPLIGGGVAAAGGWRWFYLALACLGASALLLALVTLPEQEAPNPDLQLDRLGLLLALAGTVLPFYASGALAGHGFGSLRFMVPLAVGIACFVALLLVEFHRDEPLSPVKPMWTTIPVAGTVVAMIGGGAFVALLELTERLEVTIAHRSPLSTGLLFWPQVLGVILTAVALGLLIRTRLLPLYVLGGMVVLVGGGALLLAVDSGGSPTVVLAATGLLGLGAGATVSPGLWLAGFSMPAQQVGRTFALVELVRSEADFILAPVLVQVAVVSSAGTLSVGGIDQAIRITLWVTIAATVGVVALYLGGGARLPRPDLEGWLGGEGTAVDSPPLPSLRAPSSR